MNYTASLRGTIAARIERVGHPSSEVELRNTRLAAIPVMLQSRFCNLRRMGRRQLVAQGEEETECGGYFIVNGLEKLIRMIIGNRKNYVMAIKRPADPLYL